MSEIFAKPFKFSVLVFFCCDISSFKCLLYFYVKFCKWLILMLWNWSWLGIYKILIYTMFYLHSYVNQFFYCLWKNCLIIFYLHMLLIISANWIVEKGRGCHLSICDHTQKGVVVSWGYVTMWWVSLLISISKSTCWKLFLPFSIAIFDYLPFLPFCSFVT